jgi:hypothetical protein
MPIILPRQWGAVKPASGVQINCGHPLAKGLIGCWLFNEGAGFTAIDLAQLNHGILTNMAGTTSSGWGVSLEGVGVVTDGNNDYIDAGNLPSLDVTSDITIIVRVIPASLPSQWMRIISKLTAGATYNGYEIVLHNLHQSPYGQVANGGTLKTVGFDTSLALTLGNVCEIALTYNAAAGTAVLYQNAVWQASDATWGASAIGSSNVNLNFARWSGIPTSTYFNGSYLRALLYSRTLLASEIAWLHVEPYCFLQPIIRRFYSIPEEVVPFRNYYPNILAH